MATALKLQCLIIFRSVQWLSHVQFFVTPWTAAHQASLSITNSQRLLRLISIESVMPSNHLIFCHSLLLSLQSFPASGSFQMSQLFASGGQSIGVSALYEDPGTKTRTSTAGEYWEQQLLNSLLCFSFLELFYSSQSPTVR